MSVESAKAFCVCMMSDEDFRNAIGSAASAEAISDLMKAENYDFTQDELTAAKQALLSQLRSTHDSPGAIEGYYSTAALSGLIFSHGDYMRAVEEATLEQVVACANSLQLHTTYFLKGVQE